MLVFLRFLDGGVPRHEGLHHLLPAGFGEPSELQEGAEQLLHLPLLAALPHGGVLTTLREEAEHVEERSGEVLRQVGEEGGELGGGGELRGHVPGQHPPHGLQG